MCMTFGDMGTAKAEREMNEQEPDYFSNPVEIKPFTTKAPFTTIEALDAIASTMGITRNALVLKLINQYLGQAFISYSLSYHSTYAGEAVPNSYVIGDLEKMIKKAKFTSPETEKYLARIILDALVEE